MIGVGAILSWHLDGLLTAASALDVNAERMATTISAMRGAFDIDPSWTGRARDAAEARVYSDITRLQRTGDALHALAAEIGTGYWHLASAQSRLISQIDIAEREGFLVHDDGSVTHPSSRRINDAGLIESHIAGILTGATNADHALAANIAKLQGLFDGSGGQVPTPGGDGYIGLGDAAGTLIMMSPADRAKYWESLNGAQRTALINAVPEAIGNLDGIDFADRITANDLGIRQALQAEVDAGRGSGDTATTLRSLLVPAPDPVHPGKVVPRQFIGFSPDGRYIELVGELTPAARGVGVLVPGTGTSLNNSESYRRRAASMAKLSGAPVIVWADGRFPPQLLDARDTQPAREMAPRLVTFTQALDQQLATSNMPLKTTVVGHSYGGAVVGTAEQHGMRADRVVYASASGIGVDDQPWNNPNPDVKRYSMTPPGDPIQYWQGPGAPLHGGDPDSTPNVTRLDSGFYGDGSLVEGWKAHDRYLDDENSDALANIADVIGGRTPDTYVDRAPDTDIGRDGPVLLDLLRGLVLGR